MYKIIGGDQREYGPVGPDEVRRWIAEGRLNGYSRAKKDDSTEWMPLAEFPEFADALRAQADQEPGAPPPIVPEAWTAEILFREPQLHVADCLSRSWELMRQNFGLLLGACALVWVVGLCQFVPLVGLIYKALAGVFYGGLYLVFLKRIRGEAATPKEALSGFNIAFVQLFLAGLLTWLLGAIGFCLCILPGIYLAVAWVFSVPLIADRRLEFWPAMELSRKVVTKVWFQVLALILIAFLPVILAGLFTGAKLTISLLPAFQHIMTNPPQAMSRLMETMMQLQARTYSLSFFTRLVLLFNLPFALGALMYAYESLFGSRTAGKA